MTVSLNPQTISYYDVSGKQWKADAGDFEVLVGHRARRSRSALSSRCRANEVKITSGLCDRREQGPFSTSLSMRIALCFAHGRTSAES